MAGNTYYVSRTDGVDTPNRSGLNNTSQSWRTLKYACQRVGANQGHVIRLGDGAFYDYDRMAANNAPATLKAGVSLIGNGMNTTRYVGPILVPVAANQTISNFEMDGTENSGTFNGNIGKALFTGLHILSGSDLIVENLRIEGFNNNSLWFGKGSLPDGGLRDSVLRNCEMLNNGDPQRADLTSPDRGFAMRTGDLQDCQIYGNIFREERNKGGEVWNTGGYKFTRLEVHDNTFWTHRGSEAGWTKNGKTQTVFNMEWVNVSCLDCEIYRNTFNGKVSLAQQNSPRRMGDYSVRLYENRWEFINDYAIEASHHDLKIDHNYFHFDASNPDPDIGGGWTAIYNSSAVFDDMTIHHNVFDNVSSSAIHGLLGENIRIMNNTMTVGTKAQTPNAYKDKHGVLVQTWDVIVPPLVNWQVLNNVVVGSGGSTTQAREGILINMNADQSYSQFNNPLVKNNHIHDASSGFKSYFSSKPGVETPSSGNPNFELSGAKPDPWFQPRANSPLVDNGIVISGITGTYSGSAPDIGAYELEENNFVLSNNLLSNPGFENGTSGYFTHTSMTAVTSPVKNGDKAVLITNRTKSWHGISQGVGNDLQANGQGLYYVSGWVRNEAGAGTAEGRLTVAIKVGGVWTDAVQLAARIYDDSWTQIAGMVDVGWSGTLQDAAFKVRTNTSLDNLHVDDLVFSKVLSIPAPTSGQLLSNEGFENGLAGYSAHSPAVSITSPVKSGSKAVRMYNRTKDWHAVGQGVLSDFNTYGPGLYEVSAWLRNEPGKGETEGRVTVAIKIGGNWADSIQLAGRIYDDRWTRITGIVNVDWTGTLQDATFKTRTNGSTNDLYIDEYSFVAY